MIVGLFFLLVACLSKDITDYYFVTEDVQTFSTAKELKQDTMTDAGFSKNNLAFGIYGKECADAFDELRAFRTLHRHFGPDYLILSTVSKEQFIEAFPALQESVEASCSSIIYLEAGRPITDSQMYNGPMTERDVALLGRSLYTATLTVWNRFHHAIRLAWVPEGKNEVHSAIIQSGQSHTTGVYVGHTFLARHVDTGELLTYFIVSKNNFDVHLDPDMVSKDTEKRMAEETSKLWLSTRFSKNAYQPHIVPSLTLVGFKKIRVPDELFAEILEYYNANVDNEVIETSVGVCVNQEKSPTFMTQLSSKLRTKIYNYMKPTLEEWSGMKLTPTSLYGVRKYTEGSTLHMHVDTIDTHVVSAIVNVAQDVDEDWKLEILDHNGNLHEIAMQPGDLVLYESAKALHGRPAPLKGRYYSNFFLHYKPAEREWDYSWF